MHLLHVHSSPPEVLRHGVTSVDRFLRGLVHKLAFPHLSEDTDVVVTARRQEAAGSVFEHDETPIGDWREDRAAADREAAGERFITFPAL